MILDEFRSAMDRRTENFALNCIPKIKQETAVFFIIHRLNIVPKIADRVSVLEHKSGTHQELLETSNFYSLYWKEILPVD
ncbi:ATP-binding cassette, subfamily B [Psychroflexus sediminis]|uniref:ATP-binding cassette, subfamily B n=1 Tax=Psychroflexus sediminis TaxID=470826 RepID=A0A1G7YEN1_9FLAO|nr:ATP-binding cassette, subfamily B [Psychroflexus sediminis]